jgi:hypothetical protein
MGVDGRTLTEMNCRDWTGLAPVISLQVLYKHRISRIDQWINEQNSLCRRRAVGCEWSGVSWPDTHWGSCTLQENQVWSCCTPHLSQDSYQRLVSIYQHIELITHIHEINISRQKF